MKDACALLFVCFQVCLCGAMREGCYSYGFKYACGVLSVCLKDACALPFVWFQVCLCGAKCMLEGCLCAAIRMLSCYSYAIHPFARLFECFRA
jgi:hypothetical protein